MTVTQLPSGTVTFLFTDIEGSTRRWEQHPEAMRAALARHDQILRDAILAGGGYVFKTVGDAFCAAFAAPTEALAAALAGQRALEAESWAGEIGQLRVRMALHSGVVDVHDGDYFGPPVNRVARLLSAGHGGQTLLSEVTQALVRETLPSGAGLRDMGEHRLKDLIRPERVFQVVTQDLPSDFPPLKTLDNRPNNLPPQPTPLVGREEEAAAARQLLLREDARLVTLTGPGGTGKTRLGLQVAADALEEFDDGVLFVALADTSDPDLVPSAIAQALGVRESPGEPLLDTLKDYLHDKQTLLLLDNFEQVTQASPLVMELLAAATRSKALVTSREVLRLRGEKEFPVPPLDLPDLQHLPPVESLYQCEAVALFEQRARDARPDFALTADNAATVAEICHRLDGLPLAIELAATRIKLLTPQLMLSRLESRLKLLTVGPRDLPARQQTLRNTIAWSYDLLGAGEQRLFDRLSVFTGGCTLEAAEMVCNPPSGDLEALDLDVLEGLGSLVDKSLLRQEEAHGEPRFWTLETIREYGQERLAESGELEVARQRHAQYLMGLAEQAEAELHGPRQPAWLQRLDTEHANLRAALKWMLDTGEDEPALRLCVALWWFWFTHGHLREGRRWLDAALALPGSRSQVLRAKAVYAAGRLAYSQDDYAAARAFYEESLAIFRETGDKRGIADSLNGLGLVAGDESDFSTACARHEESLAIFRELSDTLGIASSSFYLANVAEMMGDPVSQRAYAEESLVLFRKLGNNTGISASLNVLGEAARRDGDYDTARSLYEESLANARETGHKRGIATALHNLGCVAYRHGEHERAAALFAESLALYRDLENKLGIIECLEGLAGVAAHEPPQARESSADGSPSVASERAATLFGAAESLLEAIGTHLEGVDRVESDRDIATVRAQLGETAFATAWARGCAMSPEAAVAYALIGGRGLSAEP